MRIDKKALMYDNIDKHARDLYALFPDAKEKDGRKLCWALRRLEREATKWTTALCNGTVEQDIVDARLEGIKHKTARILGCDDSRIYLNHDPRGYALKLDFSNLYTKHPRIYTDWGGYGIIAPDFSPENG